jgi:hypothetical protein
MPDSLDAETLDRFDGTRELHVGARRTPIWVVVVDGDAYVRSYRGARGRWYQRARERGRMVLEGIPVDVEPVADADLNQRISDAFRAKYGARSPRPTEAMVSPEVVATTLRVARR